MVGIKAMSGASAGSIVAAIGAVALADADQEPIEYETARDGEQKIKCYLPKIYETWVVKDDFSRTRDIPPAEGEPRPVTSLLNSRLLDAIARAALVVKRVAPPRAYISKTLHIYMTMSNLRGVPYSVSFDEDNNGLCDNCYHMISHGDRVHYAVTGLGTWDSKSAFADNDQNREIEAASLVIPKNREWQDYAICALASAAFPVGLAPRLIGATLGTDAKPGEYHDPNLPLRQIGYPRCLRRTPSGLRPRTAGSSTTILLNTRGSR
jgi:hypothetical protein